MPVVAVAHQETLAVKISIQARPELASVAAETVHLLVARLEVVRPILARAAAEAVKVLAVTWAELVALALSSFDSLRLRLIHRRLLMEI